MNAEDLERVFKDLNAEEELEVTVNVKNVHLHTLDSYLTSSLR